MLTTSNDLTALGARVQALTDQAEITRLCDRYVRHLDQDRSDDSWFGSVFTDDAELTFPMGTYTGMSGLAEFHAMARQVFERTHHLSGNYDIAVDGDQARVHAHLMAVHVPHGDEPGQHFSIGGHYAADLVRTPESWRISRFVFDLVWNSGKPPVRPEAAA